MRGIEKVRKLPEPQRKMILWGIVSILGIILSVWWLLGVQEKIQTIQENNNAQIDFPIEQIKRDINELQHEVALPFTQGLQEQKEAEPVQEQDLFSENGMDESE